MFLTVFIITIVVIVTVAIVGISNKNKALRAAPTGSTRVEAIKANAVNNTVAQYAKAGWTVQDQTMAKSFGSQARVGITFRKVA